MNAQNVVTNSGETQHSQDTKNQNIMEKHSPQKSGRP